MNIGSLDINETKKKIFLAAKNEFASKSFKGARMSSIASSAGVNQALIHYHFASKENLYLQIFKKTIIDVFEEYSKKFKNELDSWNVSADIKLCTAIYVLIFSEQFIHDMGMYRMIAYEFAEEDGIVHKFLKKLIIQQSSSINEIISEGIYSGVFEVSNSTLFSINLLSSIKNLVHEVEPGQETIANEDIYKERNDIFYDFLIEFSFKALRPAGKNLKIPVLDENRKSRLKTIFKEISNEMEIF